MKKFFKIKSLAKINISLNVIKKLKSQFHKIESLITFVKLHDVIYIRNIKSKKHKIFFKGKFSKGIKSKNTISNLLQIIDKKKLSNEKKMKLILLKIFRKKQEWVVAQ